MALVEQLRFQGAGVELVADAGGPSDGPCVLFLHGAGQTRQSWGSAVNEAAERGYRAVSLDLRGHGDTGWATDGAYSLELFIADIRMVIAEIGRPPILVGASLGGLIGLLVSASPQPPIRGLVLVDVTPSFEMDGVREIRAFMATAHEGFASLEEAADAVAAYLPHRPRPKDTRGLARNLRLRDGRYYWHWDPRYLSMNQSREQLMAVQQRFKDAAHRLTLPALLIRGGRSRVVSESGVREFLDLVPHADYVDIADAHHMVAGDANDAFNKAVFSFLEKHRP